MSELNSLPASYVLTKPFIDVSEEWHQRTHADGYHTEHFKVRVQRFEMMYYSDFYDDEDEPFEGALMDSEANELAREMLREFVEEHRYDPVGKVIYDDDVDGAETIESARTHDLEYTIYYEIVEDLSEVDLSTELLIRTKKREAIEREERRRAPPPPGSLGNPGPVSTFLSDVAIGLGSRSRVKFGG